MKSRLLNRLSIGGWGQCWEWKGCKSVGYGKISGYSKMHSTHRVAYTLWRGLIPDGCALDHLCRNRACANPAHLEIVTHRENILRGTGVTARNALKTHCKYGHEFTPDNTYARQDGRECLTCKRTLRRHRSRASEREDT